jgi:tetratricopeptide (TPR) repeat protein
MIYLKLNNPQKAERYLRRAVILSPENITYKYNLAITSDRLNNHRQAIRLYRQIIEAVAHGAVIPGSITSIEDRLSFLEEKVKDE